MLAAAVAALASSPAAPEVTYVGSDYVLVHTPTSGEYWLQRYSRYVKHSCAGVAAEPAFVGNVGLPEQRFVGLGGGALLQIDTVRHSFLLRQCQPGDRLRLGLRVACPVVLEGPPQRTFANASLVALGNDVVLVHNSSGPQGSNVRAVRFLRDDVLAGKANAFERLPLSGLVWRDRVSRHELAPLGKGLVLDYETDAPAQFRIWRLNPRCAAARGACNTASDPPLQGPLVDSRFPHAHRQYVGLSIDETSSSLLHVMELDPRGGTYRTLICDSAKFALNNPLPCTYHQKPVAYHPRPRAPCEAGAQSEQSCLRLPGCGWCRASSSCITGSVAAPCQLPCPPQDWVPPSRPAAGQNVSFPDAPPVQAASVGVEVSTRLRADPVAADASGMVRHPTASPASPASPPHTSHSSPASPPHTSVRPALPFGTPAAHPPRHHCPGHQGTGSVDPVRIPRGRRAPAAALQRPLRPVEFHGSAPRRPQVRHCWPHLRATTHRQTGQSLHRSAPSLFSLPSLPFPSTPLTAPNPCPRQ